jgi:O-antigen ligase
LINKRKINYQIITLFLIYIIILFIVSKTGIFEEIKNVPNLQIESTSDRIELWKQAIINIIEKPFFGIGIDCFGFYNPNMIYDRPHNEFLQIACTMGIPALIFYLGALIIIYAKAVIHNKELTNSRLMYLSITCAYLISSFFGNSMPYTTPYFVIFLAFAVEKGNGYYKYLSSFNNKKIPLWIDLCLKD